MEEGRGACDRQNFLPYPKGSKTYAVQLFPKQTNKKGHKDSRNKRRKETIEETDETLEITPLSSGKAGEALCATHKRNTGSQQASDFLINWQKDEHLPTP